MHTITCEECGHERKTRRSNTKYCRPCRILRNITYIGDTTGTCLVCENRFAPLQRGEQICGKCDSRAGLPDPHGDCALCGAKDVSLVDSQIAVCVGCGTDVEKRQVFRAALIKKQNARREEA